MSHSSYLKKRSITCTIETKMSNCSDAPTVALCYTYPSVSSFLAQRSSKCSTSGKRSPLTKLVGKDETYRKRGGLLLLKRRLILRCSPAIRVTEGTSREQPAQEPEEGHKEARRKNPSRAPASCYASAGTIEEPGQPQGPGSRQRAQRRYSPRTPAERPC
jgi:hypothetical protein